jgi:hypothetical protein
MERPDLIDSGVLDWDTQRYGDDRGRLKEKMSFGEQVGCQEGFGATALLAPCTFYMSRRPVAP